MTSHHPITAHLRHELAEEGALDEERVGVGVWVLEHELLPHHVHQHLAHQLPHVHAADHLLEGLLAGVQAALVHGQVPLGADKVKFTLNT